MAVSNFDVLKKMASENMNIKCSTSILGGNLDKRGGVIKVGVDSETIQQMLSDNVLIITYVIDKKQFFQINKKLEEDAN